MYGTVSNTLNFQCLKLKSTDFYKRSFLVDENSYV